MNKKMKKLNIEEKIQIMKKKTFKSALIEAARWEEELTDNERSKISFAEAREKVVNRIFEKYYDNSN